MRHVPTSRYIALAWLSAVLLAPTAAHADSVQAPLRLDPATLDVAQAAQTLFTFDLVVAGAQLAAQHDAAQSRQLDHNGLGVPERPTGLNAAQAKQLWRTVRAIAPNERRAALALMVQSDVVTTEAHALLLQMLGPAPDFVPHAAPEGLGPRQLAWVRLAPQLGTLMRHAWHQAHVAALYRTLRPALSALSPSAAELADYEALLDETMGRPAQPHERVRVVVVPLMAKDTGATLMLGARGAISLVAPAHDRAERATLVVHEMLHPRVAALIAEHPALSAALAQGQCLRAALAARTPRASVSQVYDGWNDYFAESFVRGLSHQLTHSTEPEDGFLLAHALGALHPEARSADALAEGATGLLQQWTAQLCAAHG